MPNALYYGDNLDLLTFMRRPGRSLATLAILALLGCETPTAATTPCQQGKSARIGGVGDWVPWLFYDQGSTTLTPLGQKMLSEYVFRACHAGTTEVEIIGSIDTSEIGLAHGQLGRQRAEAVAALLPILGLYASKLTITDNGPFHPFVPTGMDASEPQNRRVIVLFR